MPDERIPRDKPPNLARRGEIATKTQRNSDEKAGFAKLAGASATMGANPAVSQGKKKEAAAVVLSVWNSGFGFT